MATPATIIIDPSQFPDAVRRTLIASLRSRRINHKFLYDSQRQTQKWLELHEACSPARVDPQVSMIYDQALAAVLPQCLAPRICVVGLGCGGGQKDSQFVRQLQAAGRSVRYVAVDVSPTMVLVARDAVSPSLPLENISLFVCDLAEATNLPETFNHWHPRRAADESSLFTFFGMIPNFEPDQILPLLGALLRPEDTLLFSANLAPGPDYAAGVQQILPLYDNALTREWLWLFLSDLGFSEADGRMEFTIEGDESGFGLLRVVARFHLKRDRMVSLGSERIDFRSGENLRVFFSYRHTPETLRDVLSRFGLQVANAWTSTSREEGVFWVRKTGHAAP